MRAAVAFTIIANLTLLSCAPALAQGPSVRRGAPASLPRMKAEPGIAKGRVVDAAGKPVANARITLWALTATAFGRSHAGDFKTDSNGVWRVPVNSFLAYKVEDRVPVKFDGNTYQMVCNPIGQESPGSGKTGIVQDFRPAFTGLKNNSSADETCPDDYLGARIFLWRGSGYWHLVGDNALITYTLTPVGKLADGSAGKPLTFKRPVRMKDALNGMALEKTNMLHDIPLGVYRITATLDFPGRGPKPLFVALRDQPDATVTTSVEYHFQPDRTLGTETGWMLVSFSKELLAELDKEEQN